MTTTRVLHVLHGLTMGGITKWIVEVQRRLPLDIDFDFAVHREANCPYLSELQQRGGGIFVLPNRRQCISYCRSLRRVLAHYGPYRAVHTHYNFFAGLVVAVAAHEGVPIRVVHSWTVGEASKGARLARYLAKVFGRTLIRRYATCALACSKQAGVALFGNGWEQKFRGRGIVLPGGINLALLQAPGSGNCLREEFGISPSAFVVGHVGNLVHAKNHVFLLDVFAEVVRLVPDSVLVLVGDGELKPILRAKAASLGVEGRVRFVGFRKDIPAILRTVFDVFVFPSLYEGLPIAVVEAEVTGVPVVCSDAVTREVAISDAIRFLPLHAPPGEWARAALELARRPRCLADPRDSRLVPFTIEHHVARVEEVYRGGHLAYPGYRGSPPLAGRRVLWRFL